jgi:alcohol dehydrogenase class IV
VALDFDHTSLGQRVLFRSGAAVELTRQALDALGTARPLLIATRSAGAVADRVAEAVVLSARIDGVVQHVPADDVTSAIELAVSSGADAIVSVGGGSAVGLAKGVARSTGLPIVAVPTTFAGSEATDVWGVTANGAKTTGSDARVLPRVVVYDATLTLGLTVGSAVASGLNAVAHAVDGFWAPRADPINRALGSESLRALLPGLEALVRDPDDLEARERMLYGAYLAAVAFASAGSGLHHKICHVLGGAFDLPHAPMHAVVLPYVTAFNAPAAPDAAERVSAVLAGRPAGPGLRALDVALGAPPSLDAIGLREQDLPRAVELILPAVPPSNPRAVDAAALSGILRAAWAGDPITEERA